MYSNFIEKYSDLKRAYVNLNQLSIFEQTKIHGIICKLQV